MSAPQCTGTIGWKRRVLSGMNRARHDLFAGAAFAGDEHGGISGRYGFDRVVDLLHCIAAPDEIHVGVLFDLFFQAHVFQFGALVSETPWRQGARSLRDRAAW